MGLQLPLYRGTPVHIERTAREHGRLVGREKQGCASYILRFTSRPSGIIFVLCFFFSSSWSSVPAARNFFNRGVSVDRG